MTSLHQSEYCGSWYPSEAAELRELIAGRFAQSLARTGPALIPGGLGFVVPHAGIAYSGTVAAAVYRSLREQGTRRVVVLGFSHRERFDGIAVPEIEAYATPLGEVEVDWDTGVGLAHHPPFRMTPERRIMDHSLELQLPLLRHAVPEAKVVPLYVGRLEGSERESAAAHLAGLLDGETALVASSDLTHYGETYGYVPFPFNASTREHLRLLDGRLIAAAGSLDGDLFRRELHQTETNLCGRAPIHLLLEALGKAGKEEIFQHGLDYQTSGELTGSYRTSVSYAALGYFPASSFAVDEDGRRGLLESVHRTLERYEETGERMPVRAGGSPSIERRLPAFVTLREKGELRGCIGCAEGTKPLAESVPELALCSALDDVRFDSHELRAAAEVEVSVLTPSKRIASPELLLAGEHGAILESGPHRGLLLPQVAESHHLDRMQFLATLARKAGASGNVYYDPRTRLSVFRAQVFGG